MQWNFWRSNRQARAREVAEVREELAMDDYHRAHREWQAAQRAFDEAQGSTQIDWAIYQLQASERRFALCWSRLRFDRDGGSPWKGGVSYGLDGADHASAVLSSDL